MSHLLRDLNWPQVQKAVEANTLLLLPVGQTEQHGPHLQTGCDTIIAERVSEAVAAKLNPGVPTLVMPSIPYAYNPRVIQKWPGTFRIRWEVMINFLSDVCCSAIDGGFKKIAIVSTHGPHGDVCRLAARDIFDRTGVGVVFTQPHSMIGPAFKKMRKSAMGGTSHACEYETSLLMHFGYPVDVSKLDDRDNVKMVNEWVAGDMLNGSGKVSWSTWALQESETGAYGDPSVASAETGKAAFEAILDAYVKFLTLFWQTETPRWAEEAARDV